MKIYKVKVNGKIYEVEVEAVDEVNESIKAETTKEIETEIKSEGANQIIAPIAGKVLDIKVAVGDLISKDQTVMTIEAMKLENEIQSAFAGKVVSIKVNVGDNVKNKDVLIELE